MITCGNSEKNHSVNVSSNWNNAGNAGTFNFNANNAESNVNQNISTHLANFVKKTFSELPCPLAKHNNEKHCVGRA